MRNTRLFFAAAAVSALFAAAAAAQPAPAAPVAPAAPAAAPAPPSPGAAGFRPIAPAGDILATLQASGQFNTFVKAATVTNLAQLLKAQPNITVLAPTDAAFAALPADQLQAMMQPSNVAQLQALVTYHMINTRLDSTKIKGHSATPVATVANSKVTLDGSGATLKANDADIIQADVAASNGLIQVIDKVLSPTWTAPASAGAAAAGAR